MFVYLSRFSYWDKCGALRKKWPEKSVKIAQLLPWIEDKFSRQNITDLRNIEGTIWLEISQSLTLSYD